MPKFAKGNNWDFFTKRQSTHHTLSADLGFKPKAEIFFEVSR